MTKNTLKTENSDFIIIETHFGVPEHSIRFDTRNKCSDDLVAALKNVASILYPEDDFEVYFLPPEPGSYKDIIKFVKKNKVGTTTGAVVAIGTLTLGFFSYKDSHESHLQEKRQWIIDDTERCLALQKTIIDLEGSYDVSGISEEKIKKICGDINIKKRKNNFFSTLKSDSQVQNNELSLKDSQNQCLLSETVDRKDFGKYIEPIVDEKLLLQGNEGIVDLISPVMKQKKEGKGISWRGTYYGSDITYEGIMVLKDGDDIEFYMQDQDFKEQISNKERSFAAGDNMRIIFDISGDLKSASIQNKSIYIKNVVSFNEDLVLHKERVARKKEIEKSGQDSTLFDGLHEDA